ncbi:MAG: hypothetical protein AMS25_07085 [Gemmatimonas sp. SM23_52]|nr:MAG: hypothetical protein AMS25_07085 [Gemmatimonas sp. SM23_52]
MLAVVALGSGYTYRDLASGQSAHASAGAVAAISPAELQRLRDEQTRLRAALLRKAPKGKYIVIDRTNNRLYLRQNDRVLLEAVASAGSGSILREKGGRKRTWVFDTPQGVFRVLAKTREPVWKRPDWAFIEEGKPIPTDIAERFQYGTLGEYALYFGDGYMIHGTLYERLLGRSVTHGCIRLGRNDLRTLFRTVSIGTPIYIY